LIDLVRDAALDKKGEDFTAIDVSERTILADTFVLITGRSKIQARAIADAIVEKAETSGIVPRVEGNTEGAWILIDLGNLIVHVFTPEQRRFYNLERLWSDTEQRLDTERRLDTEQRLDVQQRRVHES
jgi:ribosome-associated protein